MILSIKRWADITPQKYTVIYILKQDMPNAWMNGWYVQTLFYCDEIFNLTVRNLSSIHDTRYPLSLFLFMKRILSILKRNHLLRAKKGNSINHLRVFLEAMWRWIEEIFNKEQGKTRILKFNLTSKMRKYLIENKQESLG